MRDYATKVELSALWAAYGDALGFVTELADTQAVRRRIHQETISKPEPWSRLVGGKFGATITLPSGAYSDDTQLRLATSRAIDSDGHFDVEAFAKVELPVWLSYSLGGGVATKLAASNLAKPNVTWFSNFFSGGRSEYTASGGNGAAMRIQPLVWASRERFDSQGWIRDVLRNAICTHGHVRGIAGAVYHAVSLKWALDNEDIPNPDDWRAFSKILLSIPEVLASDGQLAAFWLKTWQVKSKVDLDVAFRSVTDECEADLAKIVEQIKANPEVPFSSLVAAIGADKAESRGSGIKTSILATVLSWRHRNSGPEGAVLEAANYLECDTDTIATMAGSILGSLASNPPPYPIQDQDYIRKEANRLATIAQGGRVLGFKYPDLLKWQAPRTQADSVSFKGGDTWVASFGLARPMGKVFESRSGDSAWQWLTLNFGQSILAKRRGLKDDLERATDGKISTTAVEKDSGDQRQESLFVSPVAVRPDPPLPSMHDLTAAAIRGGFEPEMLGRHLLLLADAPDGIELTIGYAAIVAKARRARRDGSIRNNTKS